MPEIVVSTNRTITQVDYVRVTLDENALVAWLQENPLENDWIQPHDDLGDVCAEDVRRYLEAHPDLRDHPQFHEADGEPREEWSQLEIIDSGEPE